MERVYLVGAQEVSSAGSQMARAADEMQQAARNIGGHLDQHNRELSQLLDAHARAMDSFLDGMRGIVEKLVPPTLFEVVEPPPQQDIEPAPEPPPPAPGHERCSLCSEDVPEGSMPKHLETCEGIPF